MNVKIINLKRFFSFAKNIIFSLIIISIVVFAIYTSNYILNSRLYIPTMLQKTDLKTIIIDAGHGGEDPGALGKTGALEKDINLQISNILGEMLSREGFAVIYTRTDDSLLYSESENIKGLRKHYDLKNRCKIASDYPNAILISLHTNSYSDESCSGLQVYYSEHNDNSKILANKIQFSVKENLQNNNSRNIKSGKELYILKNTENVSILIECGFISNYDECEKLTQKEYQKMLCLSILYGIIEYTEEINIK